MLSRQPTIHSAPQPTAVEPRLPAPLAALCQRLDRHSSPIRLEELRDELVTLEMDRIDLRPWRHFADDHYCRNLIRAGQAYEARLLCWCTHQASPVHNHEGSSCAFRVVEGTATETHYEMNDDGVAHPTRTQLLDAGTVRISPQEEIHQLANRQTRRLVTLHVYSPPLCQPRQFESCGCKNKAKPA